MKCLRKLITALDSFFFKYGVYGDLKPFPDELVYCCLYYLHNQIPYKRSSRGEIKKIIRMFAIRLILYKKWNVHKPSVEAFIELLVEVEGNDLALDMIALPKTPSGAFIRSLLTFISSFGEGDTSLNGIATL